MSASAEPAVWRKLGHAYVASQAGTWASSHAYCPTPLRLSLDRIRTYAAFLDSNGVGRIGYVDTAADDPTRVLGVSPTPSLDLGAPGSFDDHGLMPLCVLRSPSTNDIWLYYAGWHVGGKHRYTLFTGLATSVDGEQFERVRETPVLGPVRGEKVLRSSLFVEQCESGYRAWYASADAWHRCADGVDRPRYGIRSTVSVDGVHWDAPGSPCLDPSPDETGLARPCIIDGPDGQRHMWFGYRSGHADYRLGYASQEPGGRWQRQDALAGLPLGPEGTWDGLAAGPGALIRIGDKALLAYSGNDQGASGFGFAVLEALPK